MKFCPNCGNQLAKDEFFCTECGTKIEVAEKPVHTPPPEPLLWEVPPLPEPPEPTPTPVVTIDKAAAMDSLGSMEKQMDMGEPKRKATDAYERNMRIVPDSVKAIEGEIPIRQYNIAVLRNLLRFGRSEGRLQITNKRVIFRATGRSIGGRTALQQEFSLNEIVTSVDAIVAHRFSFFHLVCGFLVMLAFAAIGVTISLAEIGADWGTHGVFEILIAAFFVLMMVLLDGGLGGMGGIDFSMLGLALGFGGLIGFAILHKKSLFKLVLPGLSFGGFSVVMLTGTTVSALLVLISLVSVVFGLALHCLRPDLEFTIKTKSALEQSPPIRIRRNRVFWFFKQQDSIGFSEVMPTSETESAIREISAIIDDIQTRGDL
ncbi:MAG: hypothetical protein FWG63_01335 [Defluviitaleaceae bacterium]|nr:hypothetical protein [Defluviitaleaceae bacterium]